MSTKVELTFSRYLDLELLEKGITFWITRVHTQIRLKRPKGWTRPLEAIVDTGSPISVVPQKMWYEIETKPLAEDIMRGIVPKEECFFPVKIAELNGFLMDAKQESEPITFLSYLAPTDRIPLILGVESLLSKSTLYINFLQQRGYIEL